MISKKKVFKFFSQSDSCLRVSWSQFSHEHNIFIKKNSWYVLVAAGSIGIEINVKDQIILYKQKFHVKEKVFVVR